MTIVATALSSFLQNMTVLASVCSPASSHGCLHAVSISCYNNSLWMGVSNCSLWRMELPTVDEVDFSRDSLADIHLRPTVSCELWSGMSMFLARVEHVCTNQMREDNSFASVGRESHHDNTVVIISFRTSISSSSSSYAVLWWLHLPLEHRSRPV